MDLGGKLYKIPGSNRMVIFLSPGRYNFSATIPGFAGKTGTTTSPTTTATACPATTCRSSRTRSVASEPELFRGDAIPDSYSRRANEYAGATHCHCHSASADGNRDAGPAYAYGNAAAAYRDADAVRDDDRAE